MFNNLPHLGVGLGYRSPLHREIARNPGKIQFLELVTDQFLYTPEDKLSAFLDSVRDFPLIPHSVAMSVGADMPLDFDYLRRNATFVERTSAPWFSDHLCFTKVAGVDLGQLTPLSFDEETVEVVCRNVAAVKRTCDRPFLLENITYYFALGSGEMTESQFITKVLQKSDCGLLLDLNNVYLNSINIGYDPYQFLRELPLDRAVQVHLAGFETEDGMLIDTHAAPVSKEVWELLKFVCAKADVRGILLERDENLDDFGSILEELDIARDILRRFH